MAHISEEKLQAYVSGQLSVQDELAMMEHIASCDKCACYFADRVVKETVVSPPPDLRQEILEQTVYRICPMNTVKGIWERKREQRRELLAYSARVVFAMAASIVMLFTMSFSMDRTQQMPEEIIQVQQKKAFTLTRDGILQKKASQQAQERDRRKEELDEKSRNKITDSLQEASGKIGEALSDFWSWME